MHRRNEKRPADQSNGRTHKCNDSLSQAELNRAYRGFTIASIACMAYVWLCEMGWI